MTMIMILLNIVTSVYFSSMLLMALYANITFYVNNNNWNETDVTCRSDSRYYCLTEKADITGIVEPDYVDIIMIVNLVVLSVVGKVNFYANIYWNY